MKLTEEILLNGKHVIVNDNCILIRKIIKGSISEISEYVKNINLAKEENINVAGILDYRLTEASEHVFVGDFLFERAIGTSICERGVISFKENEKEFFVHQYLENIYWYENELSKRGEASQKIYDKFYGDYINLYKYSLVPSSNPEDYYFDQEKGFTITSTLPNTDEISYTDDIYLLQKFIMILIGYHFPKCQLFWESITIVPSEDIEKIKKSLHKILSKATNTLKTMGYSNREIKLAIDQNIFRITSVIQKNAMPKENIISYLEEKCTKKRSRIKLYK